MIYLMRFVDKICIINYVDGFLIIRVIGECI